MARLFAVNMCFFSPAKLFVVFSTLSIVPFNDLEGTHSNAGERGRAGNATVQGLLYANVSQQRLNNSLVIDV